MVEIVSPVVELVSPLVEIVVKVVELKSPVFARATLLVVEAGNAVGILKACIKKKAQVLKSALY